MNQPATSEPAIVPRIPASVASEFASTRRSRGTRSGRIAERAGRKNALAMYRRKTSANAAGSPPACAAGMIAITITPRAASEAIRVVRVFQESTSAPNHGAKRIAGRKLTSGIRLSSRAGFAGSAARSTMSARSAR
jgi:hypothetical protein